MDEGRAPIVEVKGHNYFVIDEDLSKGDRRCDGPALSSFFSIEGGSTVVNNLRESKRINKRKELTPTVTNELHDTTSHGLEDDTLDATIDYHALEVKPERDNEASNRRKATKVSGDVILSRNVMLAAPKAGIRCAGRQDTTRLLWLNEFYAIHEGTRGKGKEYIFQATQFLLGEQLPAEEVENMTERMRQSIWVQGKCHLPAEHVRHFSRRKTGYMFHTELNDEDARTALFGCCPEIVRVDNWLTWHQMRRVCTEVPRVVHAEDVQTRRVHVAGRENHFVCGVSAVQDLVTHQFTLARMARSAFCMYPEERLGMEINSPSIMWDHIDDIFHKLRVCMSCGRQGASSGTFTMPLLCTVYDFWQVLH